MPLIVVKIIDFKRKQDCRFSLCSKLLFKNRTAGSFHFAVFPILLRGAYPNPQDCRFSLRSKLLFKNRTAGSFHFAVFLTGGFTQTLRTAVFHFVQNVFLTGGFTQTLRTAVFHFVQNVFLTGGFTQTLSTKCYAFRWVFIYVRVCERAHTASINKNPVTFVTGFVPRTGIEPALPCDNQILSLARLPVPPSGPLY
jgi:hypothetical protein